MTAQLVSFLISMLQAYLGFVDIWVLVKLQLHTDMAGHQHLRSATQLKLIVPRYRLTVSVVGVLLLRARRPGIRYLTVFTTQH